MSSEVAVLHPKEVAITPEQTDLIKQTICKDATDAEMRLFFYDCQRRGVHPLDKLIHFTKRAGKYTPITSIDFMRQRAQASGEYAGSDEAVHELASDGFPDSCKVVVYRLVQGQRCAWTATARWKEYYPGEQLGFMWKKMPFLMLEKCAEALALRKAFPAELQGLYVKEEMDQAETRPRIMDAKREASQKIAELRQEDPVGKTASPVSAGDSVRDQQHDPPAPSSTFDLTVAINDCTTIGEVSALVKEAATKLSKADFEVIQKCAEERNRQLRRK